MGFCLLANIPIAIESALAKGLAKRVAVIDWDVHHGNGTQAVQTVWKLTLAQPNTGA
jgi:acetoin utilization deacetylase AcuC-like enzyme